MSERTTTELQVSGMSCQHCVKAVTAAVHALDAQAAVTVDLTQGKVSVASTLAADALRKAIADEGYVVQG